MTSLYGICGVLIFYVDKLEDAAKRAVQHGEGENPIEELREAVREFASLWHGKIQFCLQALQPWAWRRTAFQD